MPDPTPENATREDLEVVLGYRFNSAEQLTAALRHSSFVNEHPQANITSNERLEFLGDAVLNLAISQLLMQRYPDLDEGELSRNRHLLLGKGEALTDGRQKNSILADATEALIAAIYMDGGFDAAFGFVKNQFRERLRRANRTGYETDYKSMLQERVQSTYHDVPRYAVVEERGPDHDKTFRVRMTVAGISANGEGKSKKMAEQEAARAGLDLLDRSA